MPKKTKKEESALKDSLSAFNEIGDLRHLPKEVIESALADAMKKAYGKNTGQDDRKGSHGDRNRMRATREAAGEPAQAQAAPAEAAEETPAEKAKVHYPDLKEPDIRITFRDGSFKAYRVRKVVDEVMDDELEISLNSARKTNPSVRLGDEVEDEITLANFRRSDIQQFKSILKQKVKEAEREEIIRDYKDRVKDMVTGIVDRVEDKIVMVTLNEGGSRPTPAVMPKKQTIPGEVYKSGDLIKVIITEVNGGKQQESSRNPIIVSRADPMLVSRLFEKEVPEIYQGIIQIKAISRDPGQRAKIAVYSSNENVDPIGACIGPQGSRVKKVIQELNDEKIDIFEWSDDLQKLTANSLAPAAGVQVFYKKPVAAILDKNKREELPERKDRFGKPLKPKKQEGDELVAVVPDNQLSLAIGKKGQNAKLTSRLINHPIDIRSQSELDELGVDWRSLVEDMHKEYEERKAAEKAHMQKKIMDELRSSSQEMLSIDEVDGVEYDTGMESLSSLLGSKIETLADKEAEEREDDLLPVVEGDLLPAVEPEEELAVVQTEELLPENAGIDQVAKVAKAKRKSLAEKRAEYSSTHEEKGEEEVKPAPAARPAYKPSKPAKPRKEDLKLKKPSVSSQMRPIYSEDELEEIEDFELQEEENANWNDDSYISDEYDEMY